MVPWSSLWGRNLKIARIHWPHFIFSMISNGEKVHWLQEEAGETHPKCSFTVNFLFLFSFSFLGPHPQHMEVPWWGVESELHILVYATATATWDLAHTTAQGNTGSLTHWARPEIKTVSSWILVGFITTEPQWEFPTCVLSVLICVNFNLGPLISLPSKKLSCPMTVRCHNCRNPVWEDGRRLPNMVMLQMSRDFFSPCGEWGRTGLVLWSLQRRKHTSSVPRNTGQL